MRLPTRLTARYSVEVGRRSSLPSLIGHAHWPAQLVTSPCRSPGTIRSARWCRQSCSGRAKGAPHPFSDLSMKLFTALGFALGLLIAWAPGGLIDRGAKQVNPQAAQPAVVAHHVVFGGNHGD